MWRIILYSLVIVSLIECTKNDQIVKRKETSQPLQLNIIPYKLTENNTFVNIPENVTKESGRVNAPDEERNYIVTVASPSFLR